MESRLQRIFLRPPFFLKPPLFFKQGLLAAACLCATASFAQNDNEMAEDEKTVLDAVIAPDLDRRVIDEDKIDTENFEIGFYSGVMSVEDFGTNNVYGYRLAYHITEDWFLEGVYGLTEIGETTAESIFTVDFIGDDRDLDYYNMSLGVNLLPGEIFLGENYAFNANFFLILGAGNTRFADDEFFTYNFGTGFRLFITDWLAFRSDFRNHILTHNALGEEKSIQNLEFHAGLSLYF